MGRLLKFTRPKRRRAGGRAASPLLGVGIASAFAIGALGYVVVGLPKATPTAEVARASVQFEMCGRVRHTCVVDGDTIWPLEGGAISGSG